jgi:hypothetical protein
MNNTPNTAALLAARNYIFNDVTWDLELVSSEPFELAVKDPRFTCFLDPRQPAHFHRDRARQAIVNAASGITARTTAQRFARAVGGDIGMLTSEGRVAPALVRYRDRVSSVIVHAINQGGYWDVVGLATDDLPMSFADGDPATGKPVSAPDRFQPQIDGLTEGFPLDIVLPDVRAVRKAVKYVLSGMGLSIVSQPTDAGFRVAGDRRFDEYAVGRRVSTDDERARTAVLRALFAWVAAIPRGIQSSLTMADDLILAFDREASEAAMEGFTGLLRMVRRCQS